jgi:DNA-binding GntR family transcriptional regulator
MSGADKLEFRPHEQDGSPLYLPLAKTIKLATAEGRFQPDEALLFNARIGYLASGQAVELTHSYGRSDYYDFVPGMRREG